MRRYALEYITATALTLGAIIALSHQVLANDVRVMGAFARASAVSTAKSGVVYMTLSNKGATADTLLSIATPVAAMAMLHQSKDDGGISSMAEMSDLEIPAGQSVEMKPGGLHIMLMGLKSPLKKGGSVKITLTFAKAGLVEVDAKVGDVAQSAGGS